MFSNILEISLNRPISPCIASPASTWSLPCNWCTARVLLPCSVMENDILKLPQSMWVKIFCFKTGKAFRYSGLGLRCDVMFCACCCGLAGGPWTFMHGMPITCCLCYSLKNEFVRFSLERSCLLNAKTECDSFGSTTEWEIVLCFIMIGSASLL